MIECDRRYLQRLKLKLRALEKNREKEDLQLLVLEALDLCLDFVIKVETGKAKSVKTYQVCKDFIAHAVREEV